MALVMKKRVVILGSTGSIGTSALKVARDIPERMEVVALAAHSNVDNQGHFLHGLLNTDLFLHLLCSHGELPPGCDGL